MEQSDNIEALNYDNPLAARESVEVDTFLADVHWQDADIEGNWLDPKEEYHRPRYTLSYNGVPFAPLGGIHGLTGQPGHGKTFTFTQIMVAILRGEFYGLRYELADSIPEPRVLYIDTEMEKGNTQLVLLRVYEMMGWQVGTIHDEFRILWLREEVKSVDRWRKTLKAINEMKPTVVFLDGLIDVVSDFNDNQACQDLIYQCMAAASHYSMSMWLLLHENPGSEKMVGHAGSFLERKATDVLKTKKEKGDGVIFTVMQKKARARDLDNWQFKIEDDEHHYGHPVIILDQRGEQTNEQSSKYEKWSEEDLREKLSVLGTDTLSEFTLRQKIKETFHIGSTTAKEYIDRATVAKIILKDGNKYMLNSHLFRDGKESDDDPF